MDDRSEHPASRHGLGGHTITRLVLAAAGLALLVIFVLQNGHTVRVEFLFWGGRTRLAVALIVAALLGGLVGALLPRLRRLL